MRLLNNLMSFDHYKVVNEDLTGKTQRRSDEMFSNKGEITLWSGETINASDIVKVVKDAIYEIQVEWTTFYNFARGATIFYTYNNPQCKTMYVTEDLEIHVSANFVHDNLKMDKDLVMAILMHEIFHVVYDHIKRGNNWLSSYGLPLNRKTMLDNNLAADIEVNATLVNKGIISFDRLVNDAHALFLKKKSDNYETNYVQIISMEDILEDEKAMEKLRKMVGADDSNDMKSSENNQQDGQTGDNQDGQGGQQGGQGGQGGQTGDNQDNQNGQGSQGGNNQEGGQDGQQGGQGNQSGNNQESGKEGQGGQGGQGSQGGQADKKGITSDSNKQVDSKTEIVGEFGDSKSKKNADIFKNDNTYTDEEKKELEEIRKRNSVRNSKSEMEKRKREYVNSLSKSDTIRKIIDKANLDSKKYEDLWKKILEKFLDSRHRPGTKTKSKTYDWKNKHRMANGSYGINIPKESEDDPQEINVYVDVSGSMDTELISIIAESLVIYCNRYKYSSINVIPWASDSGGIYRIESVSKKGSQQVAKEIISILENSPSECGYGTEAKATVKSILKVCAESLSNANKKTKDDVHIIITDGEIYGIESIENNIYNTLKESFNKDVANKALKNTIWMVYNADSSTKTSIEKHITVGKKIFISSDMVKKQYNNK